MLELCYLDIVVSIVKIYMCRDSVVKSRRTVIVIGLDRHRVKNIIKRWIDQKLPGLYKVIESLCMKLYKNDCIDLFLDEPDKFREILTNQFKDCNFVYFLIRYAVIRPLLKELEREELEEKLATNFIVNPHIFKNILKDIVAGA